MFSLPKTLRNLLVSFVTIMILITQAQAADSQPEGTLGWWTFDGLYNDEKYSSTPEEACAATALRHMGTKLTAIRPLAGARTPFFECQYPHFLVWPGPLWLGLTFLACQYGYSPTWPGICTKHAEVPQRPSCSPDEPGYTVGNPVVVSSGAKIQNEIDIAGAASGRFEVARTYRTLRQSGVGQSGGLGWSFSFDRDFQTSSRRAGTAPFEVSGAFADGSAFRFQLNGEKYTSTIKKGDRLQALDSKFNEWVLSTAEGNVERFKLVGARFLMISSQTKDEAASTFSYDSENHLQSVSDAKGRILHLTWVGDVVATITGPEGAVHYQYDYRQLPDIGVVPGSARLISVSFVDPYGAELASKHYVYEDPFNRHLLTGVVDENGSRFATYTFNSSGQVVLSEHAGGAGRYLFSYPEPNKRVLTDPMGTERVIGLQYVRGVAKAFTSVSQPAGAGCGAGSSKRSLDANGVVNSKVDFGGAKTCIVNDSLRELPISEVSGLAEADACPVSSTAAIAATSRRTTTQWHPDWAIPVKVAQPFQIVSYGYNGQPDLDGKILNCAQGATLPDGKPLALLCKKSIKTTMDANGGLGFSAVPTGLERIWTFSYNNAGQMLSMAEPRDGSGNSALTSLTYYDDSEENHAKGDLHTLTDNAGGTTEFQSYSQSGRPTKIKLANGLSVGFEFDARDRLLKRTVEGQSGLVARYAFEYDAVGQMTRSVAPDGASTSYRYDEAHRLVQVDDNSGHFIQFTLDAIGNVVGQEIHGDGGTLIHKTSHKFDALNRRRYDQRGPQDPGTSYEYDLHGNLTKLTDAMGRVTTFEYDRFNHAIREVLSRQEPGIDRPVIGFAFNHQDQLAEVIDPRNLVTRYTRDGFGQATVIASPDSGVVTNQYDGAGNLVANRDARAFKSSNQFDASRRLTRVTQADSSVIKFEYSQARSGSIGKISAMTDESGHAEFTYDDFGLLLTHTQTLGKAGSYKSFAISRSYGSSGNDFGHVTSMNYPSGNRIEFTHDQLGRVAGLVLVPVGFPRIPILTNVSYLAFGPVTEWTWGGTALNATGRYRRTYDLAGRVTGYQLGFPGKGGVLRTVSYDPVGNVIKYSHAGSATAMKLDQSFYYNGQDQLTAFIGSSTTQRYSYDTNGNRTQLVLGARGFLSKISATSNRLESTSGPVAAKRYTYDASGNIVDDATIHYSYSAAGRMISSNNAGVATTYQYNGFGQRVVKRSGNTTSYYVYDPEGRLLGEYDNNGKPIFETVYLGDLPVAVLKPSSTNSSVTLVYNVYSDHLSTPRVITRASDNQIVWRWDNADPFGLDQPNDNPNGLGKFSFDQRFPGQVFDKETNNHNNLYRDYDPQIGRYVQSDPIGLKGGINTYGYVGGNPLSSYDPLGLWSTAAHNYFIGKFVAAHPELAGQYGFIDEIKAGSRYADNSKFQGGEYSYMHAMSSATWSKAQAKEMMCKYVKAYMGAYQGGARGPDSTGRRYFYLGMAMHAVMDSTSPAHTGFQYWGGQIDSVIHGYATDHGGLDSSPLSVESERDAPAHLTETLNLMNQVMNGDYSSICGCK